MKSFTQPRPLSAQPPRILVLFALHSGKDAVASRLMPRELVKRRKIVFPACDASRSAGTASLSGVAVASQHSQVPGIFSKGVGCIIGDVLAQVVSGEAANALNSLQLGLYATLLDAPRSPADDTSISSNLDALNTRTTAPHRATALIDPLWMPATVCLTAGLLKLLHGQPELMLSSCQDKMLSLTAANYILWPLTQFLNAKVVPKQRQAKTNVLMHVIWSASLSGLGHAPGVVFMSATQPASAFASTAAAVAAQIMPEKAASAATHAMQTSATDIVWSLMEHAAGALEVAVRRLEAIPSTLTQEAVSKSLDVIMNVEEMAKSPLHLHTGSPPADVTPCFTPSVSSLSASWHCMVSVRNSAGSLLSVRPWVLSFQTDGSLTFYADNTFGLLR